MNATESEKRFVTLGDIARAVDAPISQVRYVLTRDRIDAVGRAGIVRVFSEDVIDRVRSGIERTGNRHNPEAPAAR